MGSTFDVIGFNGITEDEIRELMRKIYENGEMIPVENSKKYYKWSIGNGIELWIGIDENNNVVCFSPYYETKTHMKVFLEKEYNNDCEFCAGYWGKITEENIPLVFEIPNSLQNTDVKKGEEYEVELFVQAAKVKIYENEEEFKKDPENKNYSPDFFVPTGTFRTEENDKNLEGITQVMLAGSIQEVEKIVNPQTKNWFVSLLVKSYIGEMRLLVSSEDIEKLPEKGQQIKALCYVIGKIKT